MKISKSLFLLSLILAALISASAFSADITTVTSKVQTNLEAIYTAIKNGLRILCIISFFVLIYLWIKNKIQWEELLKYAVGLILIGLANEIVAALTGF